MLIRSPYLAIISRNDVDLVAKWFYYTSVTWIFRCLTAIKIEKELQFKINVQVPVPLPCLLCYEFLATFKRKNSNIPINRSMYLLYWQALDTCIWCEYKILSRAEMLQLNTLWHWKWQGMFTLTYHVTFVYILYVLMRNHKCYSCLSVHIMQNHCGGFKSKQFRLSRPLTNIHFKLNFRRI